MFDWGADRKGEANQRCDAVGRGCVYDREFVRRVRAPPVKKANPKLAVEVRIVEEYGSPSISLKYGTYFVCVHCAYV